MGVEGRPSKRQLQAIAGTPPPRGEVSPARFAAREIAAVLIEGFDRHYRLFRAAGAEAKERFERAAWKEAQRAVQERIQFYDERVRECVDRLRAELDVERLETTVWQVAKLRYIGLLEEQTRRASIVDRGKNQTYASVSV